MRGIIHRTTFFIPVINPGAYARITNGLAEGIKSFRRPGRLHLHRAIGRVRNPTANAITTCKHLGSIAKSNSLHDTLNPDLNGLLLHGPW